MAIQWSGYSCDNEIYVTRRGTTSMFDVSPYALDLELGRTYRVIVNSPGLPVHIELGGVQQGGAIDVGILTVIETPLDLQVVGPDVSILRLSVATSTTSATIGTSSSPITSTNGNTDSASSCRDPLTRAILLAVGGSIGWFA